MTNGNSKLEGMAGNTVSKSSKELLRVVDLHAYYGESHVLHGIDFNVGEGELVTLLGRNGSGRTSTLKSIIGLIPKRSGSVTINGHEAINLPPYRIAPLGIGP